MLISHPNPLYFNKGLIFFDFNVSNLDDFHYYSLYKEIEAPEEDILIIVLFSNCIILI